MGNTLPLSVQNALKEFSEGKTTERNVNTLLRYGGIIKKVNERISVQYYEDGTTGDFALTELGKKQLNDIV